MQPNRRFILTAAAALVLAACASTPRLPPPPPPDPATQMSALETRINQLIDQQRALFNPNAQILVLDSELVGIARRRSIDMANRNTFTGPEGDTHISATMLMGADARFQGLLGENVAAQHYTKQSGVDVETFAKRFVDTWVTSKPHKDNLAFPEYNRTGVGAAVNGDTVYVTQLFATDLGLGPYQGPINQPQKVSELPNTASAIADKGLDVHLRGTQGGSASPAPGH